MKQAVIALSLSMLFLVGCTLEQLLPTVIPTAQAPITTPILLSQTTETATPPDTITATWDPTETSFPLPTVTPEPAIGMSVTPDPSGSSFIEGYLLFFGDKETPVEEPAYYSIPVSEPRHDLYVAIPDKSPEHWQTFAVLSGRVDWPDEYTSWPRVAVSPDLTQIAFTLYKRIDASSYVVNISVADFVAGTLTQITDDNNAEIYNISWLPDNRTVLYSVGQEGLSASVDPAVEDQFAVTFPSNITKLGSSPDGRFVAVILQTGDFFFYDMESKELISPPIDSQLSPNAAIWSPNSDWFAVNQISSAGLMALNVQTDEHLTLAELESFSLPSWSSAASLLAFVKGTREATDLYIWDPASQEARLITNLGSYLDAPVWSPQGGYLAVAFVKDETADLLSIDTKTDEINIIARLEDVKQFKILSWSPDEQWLLVLWAQEDKSCLYIINQESGDAYCAVDSTGTVNPFAVHWLPGEPLLP